jgi:glycine amidinotransferase
MINGESNGVHSYDEWSKLREVIVGVADHYEEYHLDVTFKLFFFENLEPILADPRLSSEYLGIPRRIVDELMEDIDGFVTALKGFGAVVRRPQPLLNKQASISSPFWSSRETSALNIRDQAIILGETILETAPHVRARYFENDYLKPIFYTYFARGSRWISMPKPTLARGSLDFDSFKDKYISSDMDLEDQNATALPRLGKEIVFDGAQCIRLGKDIITNVSNKNHALGLEWMSAHFGQEFRFHRVNNMADNHIDSIIMPLRPGLLLIRSPEYVRYLPESFQKWDLIIAPPTASSTFPDYQSSLLNLASEFVDMNVLSLDENTVIVNSLYPELVTTLELRGFDVLPVRHRHRRLFGGGFHCFTLDCVRDGGYEDYLC